MQRMLRLDLDIKMLELVLVLEGRRNGHHVEVESKEEHTVTHQQTIDDRGDNQEGRERNNKTEDSENYGQEDIDDGHDIDVDVEHRRFDHVNGTESQDGEEETKKTRHKHGNIMRQLEFQFILVLTVVRVSQKNRGGHADQQLANQLDVQDDQAAQFDGLEDCASIILLDKLGEEDVVDEEKTSIQEKNHPRPNSHCELKS